MPLIRLLTDLDGRIDRSRFWLGSVLVALALLAVRHVAAALADPNGAAQIAAFAGAFALFPYSVLAAKRSVDRGGSSLFGIALVSAIVLPGEIKPFVALAWEPSLDTIALIAWIVALVDLGLMPSAAEPAPLADASPDAKGAAWTSLPHTPPSPSIPSTPSH